MTVASNRVAAGVQTRARLLDAAISRLAETGPDATFDLIASDVGVTKGALYHHFGSKEGLVIEVYKEAIRRHAEQIIDAPAAPRTNHRLGTTIRFGHSLLS